MSGRGFSAIPDDGVEPPRSFLNKYGKILACLVVLGVAGVVIGFVISGKKSDEDTKPWQVIRLPENIRPVNYTLEVEPNFVGFNFTGIVKMDFEVKDNDAAHLLMHILDLEIYADRVTLSKLGGAGVAIARQFPYPKHQFWVIEPSEVLTPGFYRVSVPFSGILNDALVGFYRSSYVTPEGERRWLATTKFEPTHARRAFPCLDEPAMKANWTISLTATGYPFSAYSFLSNSVANSITVALPGKEPQAFDTQDDAKAFVEGLSEAEKKTAVKRVDFKTTVQMSTYLVAYIACDFAHIDATTPAGTHIAVWAPPHNIALGQAQLALDIAVKVLPWFEDLFGLPYPMPKQDLVAIPDFASGAMENWGLITFRTTAILYDAVESSASDRQRVATVVAHELSHQWFGNLVTMAWWDGLWLNEGFARFLEYAGTANVYPEWEMDAQFVAVDLDSALNLDATDGSHAILQTVSDPNQINELFDSISYDKGASVIRMMRNFLGSEDTFLSGLRSYLRAHLYDNAETPALWEAMTAAAKEAGLDIDVGAVMDSWTKQMGYPVLTVDVLSSSPTKSRLRITGSSRRFVTSTTGADDGAKYQWLVPLNVVTKAGPIAKTHWLGVQPLGTDPLEIEVEGEFVKLDAASTTFARVLYAAEQFGALEAALLKRPSQLAVVERSKLLSDAFALAQAGLVDIRQAFNMSRFLRLETEPEAYPIWLTGARSIKRIATLLAEDTAFGDLATYMRRQLHDVVRAVGFRDDGVHLQQQLRTAVLSAASEYDDSWVISQAITAFNAFRADPTASPVPVNLRAVVYTTAIRSGGQDEFDFLYARYLSSDRTSAAEAARCLNSLSASRVPWLLQRLLDYSSDPAKIRSQDATTVIQAVSANPVGQRLAWNFLKANWDDLYSRFGANGNRKFGPLVGAIIGNFKTQADLDEITAFVKPNGQLREVGPGSRMVTEGLGKIAANIKWKEANRARLLSWLQAENGAAPAL